VFPRKQRGHALLLLCRLAYHGFFDWYFNRAYWRKWKDPQIIFIVTDLKKCGIEMTMVLCSSPTASKKYSFLNFGKEWLSTMWQLSFPTNYTKKIWKQSPYFQIITQGNCRPN